MINKILVVLKSRLDNLVLHIDTNTKYDGNVKTLKLVSDSLKNILKDLPLEEFYRSQINNVLWHIENNLKVLGEEKILVDVRQALNRMSNDLQNI